MVGCTEVLTVVPVLYPPESSFALTLNETAVLAPTVPTTNECACPAATSADDTLNILLATFILSTL